MEFFGNIIKGIMIGIAKHHSGRIRRNDGGVSQAL